jgi:hypothetical protein
LDAYIGKIKHAAINRTDGRAEAGPYDDFETAVTTYNRTL